MHTRIALALFGICAAASAAAADDTFHCGSKLVDTTMSRDEIRRSCGEPTSTTEEDIPQQVRRANGTTYVSGTIHVETWTYDRGSSKFPAVLRFEDGKLVRIEIVRP